MAVLTANRNVSHLTSTELRQFLCGVDIIYRGGFVGIDPAGYAKAFEVGDRFVGIAYEEIDNSAGSAGDKKVRVYVEGDFEHLVAAPAAVAIADFGKAVYATDDSVLSYIGHPDAWVGRIIHRDTDTTTNAVIRLRTPFDKLTESDTGSYDHSLNFDRAFSIGGAASGQTGVADGTGVGFGHYTHKSILGLGNLAIAGTTSLNPGMKMQMDATNETALNSLRSWCLYSVAGGITFETTLHFETSDVNTLDADWGLGTLLTTNSEADIDHADMAQLACYHLDGADTAIYAQSDDATTDVAATDTTIVNVATDAAASFKDFKVIVRKAGTVEFWIDGARVLSSTSFGVLSTAVLQSFINIEKTSTTVAECNIIRVRTAGANVQAVG